MSELHPGEETIPAEGAPQEAQTVAPQWAIVEIFGHRRHVGIVSEAEQFGAKMLRIDVPGSAQGDLLSPAPKIEATFFYGGASIFSMTPVTAERGRAELARMRGVPEPARLGVRPELDYDDAEDDDDHAEDDY